MQFVFFVVVLSLLLNDQVRGSVHQIEDIEFTDHHNTYIRVSNDDSISEDESNLLFNSESSIVESEDSNDEAARYVARMNDSEVISLLHGHIYGENKQFTPYVGNNPGNKRIGIPPLHLNDGPQGFRTMGIRHRRTTSAFPSALALACTFDLNLARLFGESVAEEFVDKGANVYLGPGLELARVPVNGRTFEYLSGEDPILGGLFGVEVIKGVQSKGVVATAKHYAVNNQETDRADVNTVVDERTLHEMYLLPYKYAVKKADVKSIMCSYNVINGNPACSNEYTLQTVLKKSWGFKGWVMSDWFAAKSTVASAKNGMDQEMPISLFYSELLIKAAMKSGSISSRLIREKARRIIKTMIDIGIMEKHKQGVWNPEKLNQNVTTLAHSKLCRQIASNSITLLKNEANALPLSVNLTALGYNYDKSTSDPIIINDDTDEMIQKKVKGKEAILMVGDACHDKVTVVGQGSGHVIPPYIITPFQGVSAAFEKDNSKKIVYIPTKSLLKAKALLLLKQAKTVIICVSATSTEGADRKTLALSDADNHLVTEMSKMSNRVIVVASLPGAILMPWAFPKSGPSPAAIIACFMCGQEYGNAVADVLIGKVNPSGRLAITFPNKDNEVDFTPSQYPGVNKTVHYSEKQYIGYRWYDKNNVKPLFPFGYGLSYTTFAYEKAQISNKRLVTFTIKNTGNVYGSEVAQIYLAFPQSADKPPKVLIGFEKVAMLPGDEREISFQINDDDHLSTYDTSSHKWKVAKGDYMVLIASSSAHIHHQLAFRV